MLFSVCILIVQFFFQESSKKIHKKYCFDLFGARWNGQPVSIPENSTRMPHACLRVPHTFLVFSPGGEDYGWENVLGSQLSELLAGSSLTLITFSSSTLQLADVTTNFCHILNLYIAFLARVQLKSVSNSDIFIQRWGSAQCTPARAGLYWTREQVSFFSWCSLCLPTAL